MKTNAAGGAEALGACASTVFWAISFHFETSFGTAARATSPVFGLYPAAAATKTSAAAVMAPTVRTDRGLLISSSLPAGSAPTSPGGTLGGSAYGWVAWLFQFAFRPSGRGRGPR